MRWNSARMSTLWKVWEPEPEVCSGSTMPSYLDESCATHWPSSGVVGRSAARCSFKAARAPSSGSGAWVGACVVAGADDGAGSTGIVVVAGVLVATVRWGLAGTDAEPTASDARDGDVNRWIPMPAKATIRTAVTTNATRSDRREWSCRPFGTGIVWVSSDVVWVSSNSTFSAPH